MLFVFLGLFVDGELLGTDAYETNPVVELASPITVTTMFGRQEPVDVVKCHTDDPAAAVRAYERLMAGPGEDR